MPAKGPTPRERRLAKLNRTAKSYGRIEHLGTTPFGPKLQVERFRLANGLSLLLCEDHSAPVVAYHSWYRVGSRHEQSGKTGLAHLFEHLMFNETEHLKKGEFDQKLEEAGAESNAATWLDWTHYHVAVPKDRLKLVARLEAERMTQLVVRDAQVESEKEVVANERRYRVEDDVESSASELLWATAFRTHAYHWPTIGWMQDIEAFETEDCIDFYRTYYSPNNATIVICGDVSEAAVLSMVQASYGELPPSVLPLEDARPEPAQDAERRCEITKPTATEKVHIGYKSPALGDFDHPALAVLSEVLFGGRASRIVQDLVREREIATDARAFVGPFHDPSLIEVYASAREGHSAEELLQALERQFARVRDEPIVEAEIQRAQARLELGLVAGLETADGKASTIGFYETVLGRPGAAFERLEAFRRVSASDLRRVARRYLVDNARTVVIVRASQAAQEAAQ